MKTFRKTVLTGLAALSMGAAAIGAHAQTQTSQSSTATQRPHLTRAQRQAKITQMIAQREAKLHADLGITSGQESAWATFVAAMQPNFSNQQSNRAAWASLTAPQRMQKRIDMQTQRTAAMQQRLTALNTFYSVLTPQQKQIFDTDTAQMRGHRFGHGARANGQAQG
ncbi:MAG TPA: Spy/CpxP family protein refolding chaperone [Telluria sp.]|jgi:Spy/CpxP family protein refolding chaperone